jgi:hypothetical protein
MKIIGISGKSQSGKDTIAKFIYLWYYNQRKQIILNSFNDDELLKIAFSVKDFAQNIITVRFADKIKDIVCMLIGCTRTQLEDNQFKETPLGEEWWYYKSGDNLLSYNTNKPIGLLIKPTPRLLLQQIGTECGRNIIHPNVWVNATAKFINLTPLSATIIIPDLRFKNEFDFLKQKKAITIRVQKDNISNMNHESETQLDNESFDYVIYNNKSVYDLWLKVKEIMEYESKMY